MDHLKIDLINTIIGGEVNLASRLESNAMTGQILISQLNFMLLIKKHIVCEKKDEIKVKYLFKCPQINTFLINKVVIHTNGFHFFKIFK